jgi:hypothetical protein
MSKLRRNRKLLDPSGATGVPRDRSGVIRRKHSRIRAFAMVREHAHRSNRHETVARNSDL